MDSRRTSIAQCRGRRKPAISKKFVEPIRGVCKDAMQLLYPFPWCEDEQSNLRDDTFKMWNAKQIRKMESCTEQVEAQVYNLQVSPEELLEHIRQDYKHAVLHPFPWCEDKQLKLANIYTRLQIVSRTKQPSVVIEDSVNIADAFIPNAESYSPRVVLIQGNPGMGKTTYCQKLAYDWSMGNIPASFPKVEMLLLLKCRDMKTANIEEAIGDQLLPQDVDKDEKENFLHFVRSTESRILLVLDGLDELCQDLVEGFLPLIQGKVLSNMHLILTARPELGMEIRQYCDSLLEILGYTQQDVNAYIKNYFRSHKDQSLADKMTEQLSGNEELIGLMANPLNTALLCLVFEETRGVFPSKRTKMYDALVSCALRKYLAKRGVYLNGDDPLERCADQLNQLGKVAFEALLEGQVFFSPDEIQSKDFLQFPFLSCLPSALTPCYAFMHLTFQEYFAALYLAHQILIGDTRKASLLAQLTPVLKYWQVWKFLLTMAASESDDVAVFLLSSLCVGFNQTRPEKIVNTVTVIDGNLDNIIDEDEGYEWECSKKGWSENETAASCMVINTLHLIAECDDDDKELKDYQKKMVHELAHCYPVYKLALCMENSRYFSIYSEYLEASCILTDLHLIIDFENKLLLETMLHVLHPGPNLVRLTLEPTINDPSICSPAAPSFDKLLAEVLRMCPPLTHLFLFSVPVSDLGIHSLSDMFQLKHMLTHLKSDAMIRDAGAIALAKVLQSNSNLSHLSLPQNLIGVRGIAALAQSLHTNHALTYLDLSGNLGNDSGAEALAQALENNCSLKFLDLRCVHAGMKLFSPDSDNIHVGFIGPTGASALARSLETNCTLTYLNLHFNKIGDSGAVALGKALQSNHTLTHLYLGGNEISNSGAKALGRALESNCTVTHLNLGFNAIQDSGVAAFAKALQSIGIKLTHLDLAYNKISSSGATVLAKALKFNRSLTHLGLGYNRSDSSED